MSLVNRAMRAARERGLRNADFRGFEEDEMLKHEDVTSRVIAAFYHVYNTLGYGFLEKVYQNAMANELRRHGLRVQSQALIRACY